MSLLVSAHIVYNISAIKGGSLKVTKTKGDENPIYLIKFDLEYYINNKKLSKFGSGKKPKMGFFNIIIFLIFTDMYYFVIPSQSKIIIIYLWLFK